MLLTIQSRAEFLNRGVETKCFGPGAKIWVIKIYVLLVFLYHIGHQIVFYSVLWVTNCQLLRTTGLELL